MHTQAYSEQSAPAIFGIDPLTLMVRREESREMFDKPPTIDHRYCPTQGSCECVGPRRALDLADVERRERDRRDNSWKRHRRTPWRHESLLP